MPKKWAPLDAAVDLLRQTLRVTPLRMRLQACGGGEGLPLMGPRVLARLLPHKLDGLDLCCHRHLPLSKKANCLHQSVSERQSGRSDHGLVLCTSYNRCVVVDMWLVDTGCGHGIIDFTESPGHQALR